MAVISVMAILVFSGLIGCSKSPLNSEEPQDVRLLKRSFSAYKTLGDSAYIERIVSADLGGRLLLYDVQLYFPPRALSSDTLIFVNIPDLSVFANHFGTDGLAFNVPVQVVMSYRDADLSGVDESSIKMAWFNEEIGKWDIIDCSLNQDDKTVTAYVEHFSAYALITDE